MHILNQGILTIPNILLIFLIINYRLIKKTQKVKVNKIIKFILKNFLSQLVSYKAIKILYILICLTKISQVFFKIELMIIQKVKILTKFKICYNFIKKY
jgi:hypothetical protein